MKFLKLIPTFLIFYGISLFPNLAYSESIDPNKYKVLSSTNKTLSIANVETFIEEGDKFIENGNFEKAKAKYDKARDLAKQLSGFYRDLNGSFRKIDARIPMEMDKKGRESLKMWAKSNARLISLYKRKKQPEVSVPLLIEIIRLMSPNSKEGKEAYDNLIQIGFVETPYKGY